MPKEVRFQNYSEVERKSKMIEFTEIRKVETRKAFDDTHDLPMGSLSRINDGPFVWEDQDLGQEIWFDENFTWDEVMTKIQTNDISPNHTDGFNTWVMKNP